MIRKFLLEHLEKHASKKMVLSIDLGIISFSVLLTYIIRFGLGYNFSTTNLSAHFPIIFAISLLCFVSTSSYKGVIRQTGAKDIYRIFVAILCIWCFCYILTVVNRNLNGPYILNIPISIVNLFPFIGFIGLVISRILFKYGYYYVKYNLGQASKLKASRVLIYGASDGGIRTLNTIINNSDRSWVVIGFIDDDKNKKGRMINGIKIYHPEQLTEDFVKSKVIHEIIISPEKVSSNKLSNLSNKFINLGLQLKKVPDFKDWINGKLHVSQIKNIQIEDLLERPSIHIQNDLVPENFLHKTILLTGAAGSIGSELARQLSSFNSKKLILLDQSESGLYDIQQELYRNNLFSFEIIIADVRDKDKMYAIIEKHKPDIIFHAAAYKHVPLMEQYPEEAIKTNILGTVVLADLADSFHVEEFILISTDKAVNPTNVMGASKRAAELYLQVKSNESNTKFITTRFGNVLGSAGSVIPLFKKQIEQGGPITVTHKDITRFFMTIPEAAQLVIEAATMGQKNEIFVFDMGKPVKINDLAKKMIRLSGYHYPEDIDIVYTGIRPGEKLFEELLANSENTSETYHQKIMIHTSNPISLGLIKRIRAFFDMNYNNNSEQLVKHLKAIVPEFKSNNSVFEILDTSKLDCITVDK